MKTLSKTLDKVWCLFRESWLEFLDINPFQLGAALAYYAVFALPPVIVIMINTAGIVYGREAVQGEIYKYMRGYIGQDGALELQQIVSNISKSEGITVATIIGIVAFLIAATGAFISMQDSLNFIWGVKPKPKNEYLKLLRDRFMSFLMILGIAALLLVMLIIHSTVSWFGAHLLSKISGAQVLLAASFNLIFSTLIIAALFAAIYKYLPDAEIHWRDVRVGAGVTAALFTIGKILIATYIAKSNLASVYGAAGIMAVLLTWVFYSSQILFFGAVFTLVYSRKYGENIYPSAYAVHVLRQELETGHTPLNAEAGKYAREQPD